MEITIYHGSEHVIERPEFGKGNIHNDYGKGFYCTESLELAKEWACANDKDGFANEYVIDFEGLKVLDLNDEDHNILNWLSVLAENRTYWQKHSIAEEAKEYLSKEFHVDMSGYDIIRGYRADDSYFSFAQDFVAGVISIEKLSEAMHLGVLGEQIVLHSEKAFDAIEYVGSETAGHEEYYAKKASRDRKAREEYRSSKRAADPIEGLYMIDILREHIKNDDPRLKEVAK